MSICIFRWIGWLTLSGCLCGCGGNQSASSAKSKLPAKIEAHPDERDIYRITLTEQAEPNKWRLAREADNRRRRAQWQSTADSHSRAASRRATELSGRRWTICDGRYVTLRNCRLRNPMEVVGPNVTELWISIDENVTYEETVVEVQEVVDGYTGLYRDLLTYLTERNKEVLTPQLHLMTTGKKDTIENQSSTRG